MNEDSNLIEKAVQSVLLQGLRTADISQGEGTIISTQEMGKAVINELKVILGK